MIRIMLTGHTGFIGRYLVQSLTKYGDVVGVSRGADGHRCDLVHLPQVESTFKKLSPDLIIHCAGELDVDICQQNMMRAWKSNLVATRNIVRCSKNVIPIVFLSSIAVYPDSVGFHEEANVGPENFYGLVKLFSEALVSRNPNSLVFRFVSFGKSTTNKRISLSDHIMRQLKNGQKVNLFHDEFFNPLHVETLAILVVRALENELRGIYNLGTLDGLSKYDFGVRVAKHLGLDPSLVRAVSYASNTGRMAPRARDSRLSIDKLTSDLGWRISIPTIDEEIGRL